MLKKLAWTVILVIGLAAAVGGAALATGAFTAEGHSAASAAPPTSSTDESNGNVFDQATSGKWFGNAGGFGHGGSILRVTGVSGNTITGTTRGGQTESVTVSSSTTYSEAGIKASLSDVHKGSIIAVRASSTSGTTISATSVTILLPTVAGVVTSAGGSSITLSTFDGTSQTVLVDPSTRYLRAGKSVSLSSVKQNSAVTASGNVGTNGQMTAVVVEIRLPTVAGQVTKISGSSYTVSGFSGHWYGGATTTVTVDTSSSTTFLAKDGSAAKASSIKVGTTIVAEGTLSSDRKTLQAERVTILPAAAGPGQWGGHFGGWGGRFFGGPGSDNAPPQFFGFQRHGGFQGGFRSTPFAGFAGPTSTNA